MSAGIGVLMLRRGNLSVTVPGLNQIRTVRPLCKVPERHEAAVHRLYDAAARGRLAGAYDGNDSLANSVITREDGRPWLEDPTGCHEVVAANLQLGIPQALLTGNSFSHLRDIFYKPFVKFLRGKGENWLQSLADLHLLPLNAGLHFVGRPDGGLTFDAEYSKEYVFPMEHFSRILGEFAPRIFRYLADDLVTGKPRAIEPTDTEQQLYHGAVIEIGPNFIAIVGIPREHAEKLSDAIKRPLARTLPVELKIINQSTSRLPGSEEAKITFELDGETTDIIAAPQRKAIVDVLFPIFTRFYHKTGATGRPADFVPRTLPIGENSIALPTQPVVELRGGEGGKPVVQFTYAHVPGWRYGIDMRKLVIEGAEAGIEKGLGKRIINTIAGGSSSMDLVRVDKDGNPVQNKGTGVDKFREVVGAEAIMFLDDRLAAAEIDPIATGRHAAALESVLAFDVENVEGAKDLSPNALSAVYENDQGGQVTGPQAAFSLLCWLAALRTVRVVHNRGQEGLNEVANILGQVDPRVGNEMAHIFQQAA